MNRNEQNFDKELKRILDNPPPMDPSKEVLEEMFERLETHAPSALGSLLLWPRPLWLSLALLPFLVGFGYLFYQLSLSQQKIHELELQLLQPMSVSDTTIHHQVIYRYDTVVHVRYIENRQVATYGGGPSARVPFPPSPLFSSYSSAYTNRPSHTYLPNRRLFFDSSYRGFRSFQKDDYLTFSTPEKPSDERYIYQVQAIPRSLPLLSSLLTSPKEDTPLKEVPPLLLKKASIPFGYHLRFFNPDEVEVMAQFQRASVVPRDHPGLGGGLSARIGYGKSLGIMGGVELTRWNFEEKEESEIENYPSGTPRNAEDRLKELYVTLSLLEVPMGVQYRLFPQNTWNPYIGVETLFRKAISQNLGYEYINNFEEYRVDVSTGSSPWSFGGLRLSGGVQYPLTPNLNLTSGLWYATDLQDTPETLIPMDRWGVKVGVGYVVK